jgi:hypothetical protein
MGHIIDPESLKLPPCEHCGGFLDLSAIRNGNVSNRRAGIQTATTGELKILACTPGGKKREKEVHTAFEHLRIRGEWFRPDSELLNFVAGIRDLSGESV